MPNKSLYTNRKGFEITRFSYSQASDFAKCKRYYKLRRIDGWSEKENKAARHLGTVVEAAIGFYHLNDLRAGSGVEEFIRLWAPFKDKELVYSKEEKNWETLQRVGIDFLRLYEIRLPGLPIRHEFRDGKLISPKFQVNYIKEVFPGSEYAGLEDTAFIDLINVENGRPTSFIDMKVSAAAFPQIAGIAGLDAQLRHYSWITGIADGGFLRFEKEGLGYKKGSRAILLVNTDQVEAGTDVIFFKEINDAYYTLLPEQYEDYLKKVQALEEEEEAKRAANGGKLPRRKKEDPDPYDDLEKRFIAASIAVSEFCLTKQRIRFYPARFSDEDRIEAGEFIGQQLVNAVAANEAGKYPKEPGVQFPNRKCPDCIMLGHCANNSKLVEEKLVRIDSDWLDELEDAE